MKPDQHYTDPRLVSIYDYCNPRGIDTDFFVELAGDICAKNIVDLGCGTGLLARELYQPGRSIVGVDPSQEMIAYAKSQPGANNVDWKNGDASSIGMRDADLIIMSGNVSQVFLRDSDWLSTLNYFYKSLRPRGILVFESRNPEAQAWKTWVPEVSFKSVPSQYGSIETWLELVDVSRNLVRFQGHYRFTQTGEVVIADSTLRFRSLSEFSASLTRAGFSLKNTFGSWRKKAFESSSPVMIIAAERT